MEYFTFIINFLPYLAGYLVAWGLSFLCLNFIYEEIWREIPKNKSDQDHELHRYYGRAIGALEQIIYLAALLQPKPTYTVIGIWLAFKVAGRWERSKIEYEKNREKDRLYIHVIYSNFTIGNAFSLIYAFIGVHVTLLIQKGNIPGLISLIIGALLGSSIFYWFTKRQSERVKDFYKRQSIV